MNLAKPVALCALVLLVIAFPVRPAMADIEVSNVDWTTAGGVVTFQLTFHNLDPVNPSQATTGELWSQEFGTFLPDYGLICTYDVPEIPPDSFFDVFCDVPLGDLPPSALQYHDWDPPAAPGVRAGAQANPCLADDHWDGNVDIYWSGGAGQITSHLGTLNVCAGLGASWIHVVTGCGNPASWAIAGLCANFTATLVNEDLSPAPNPVPPGWSGYLSISANASVAVGTVCNFTLSFTCNNVTVPIQMTSEVCDCSSPVERSTWGHIKALYD